MDRGARKFEGETIISVITSCLRTLFFKIIHLVRDPRAMLASMMQEKPTWLHFLDNFREYCEQIQDDLTMARNLSKSRFETI